MNVTLSMDGEWRVLLKLVAAGQVGRAELRLGMEHSVAEKVARCGGERRWRLW